MHAPSPAARLSGALPRGGSLPDEVFWSRHRVICGILALHAAAITAAALARGLAPAAVVLLVVPLVSLAVVAFATGRLETRSRAVASCIAASGLLVASAELIGVFHGLTEMHFAFFVDLAIVALYQEWLPYLIAVAFVLTEHGLVGALEPGLVYGHGTHAANPWLWALVHAAFVAAASVATLASWRQQEASRRQADADPLTGLANHRYFHEQLRLQLDALGRRRGRLSLVLLDLDHFKGVNDRYGHQEGDLVLVEVANRLRAVARQGDVMARIGGEEFAWLLPDADAPEALAAAERLLEAVRSRPVGSVPRLTVSAGVCESRPGDCASRLLEETDGALYAAKAGGRDTVRDAASLATADDGIPPGVRELAVR